MQPEPLLKESPSRVLLFEKPQVQVYSSSSSSLEASCWDAFVFQGTLRLIVAGSNVSLVLVHKESDNIFASCGFPMGEHGQFVRRATDSRCHFGLLMNSFADSNSSAACSPTILGIGFPTKLDALDFEAALLNLRPADEEHVAKSMREMRHLLGPHASSCELWVHLHRFSSDVRKAANGYLRSVCIATGAPFDFQPNLKAGPEPRVDSKKELPSPSPVLPWLELEPHLFPALDFLGLANLNSVLLVSGRLWQRISSDDAWWSNRFAAVFDEDFSKISNSSSVSCGAARGVALRLPDIVPELHELKLPRHGSGLNSGVHVKAKANTLGACGFRAFTDRWCREISRTCPKCKASKVLVPVVYGYPSPALVEHHRRGLIVLMESCGLLGPTWACLGCRAEWDQYPFGAGALPRSRV